jgi:hypothetical protein
LTSFISFAILYLTQLELNNLPYQENQMKLTIALLISFGILIPIYIITNVNYLIPNEYDNKIYSEWNLSDRSSTIASKSEHLSNFYANLEKNRSSFSDNAAIFLKSPSNSFDLNLKALKTLIDRLDSIKNMDQNSFAYQSAIQQITAQEQGEAKEMLSVFKTCWMINTHPIFYLGLVPFLIIGIIMLALGFVLFSENL